jgi:xanthine dehydrogenase YagS FAD-binding subunit
MEAFDYCRAENEREALEIAAEAPGAAFVAGGTDFLQLWREAATAPDLVIDISRLPLNTIEARGGGVAIGALARMSDVADNPVIRSEYPAISQALLASASPQIRNVATVGGNLLQRTRCPYFRSTELPCNKRQEGSGCSAISGENRLHAIFGTSDHCVATNASDLAVALVALNARIRLRSRSHDRILPLEDFYSLPGQQPAQETVLRPGELLVETIVPNAALAHRSHYLKVRDRASFEFAVVSVAAALRIEKAKIVDVGLAAGGVGTKPWRLRASETALMGERPNERTFLAAAEKASDGASALRKNAFKIELLRRVVFRALKDLLEKE